MVSITATVRRVMFAAFTLALCAGAAQIGDAAIAERIDATLVELYPADGPGAVVLAARGDKVVFCKAYGLANLEHRVPMTTDAVFRAASVNKLFTAVAVLALVEEGGLELDDAVTKHLPSFPEGLYGATTLTVRHLLTHTSGLPEVLDRPDARTWIRSELTLDELIASFAERPRAFAPGASSAYCNSNYVLLAAILERVSGQGYAEVLRERVFEPAGMTRTRCGDFGVLTPGRAAGYEPDGAGGFINEKYYSSSVLTGAGDGMTTAGDLHRFFVALFGGELVSESTLRASLQAAELESGKGTRYGIGWELDRVGRRRAALKGGAISGFTHYVLAVPDEDVFVVLLTNRGPEEGRRPGMLCVRFAGWML